MVCSAISGQFSLQFIIDFPANLEGEPNQRRHLVHRSADQIEHSATGENHRAPHRIRCSARHTRCQTAEIHTRTISNICDYENTAATFQQRGGRWIVEKIRFGKVWAREADDWNKVLCFVSGFGSPEVFTILLRCEFHRSQLENGIWNEIRSHVDWYVRALSHSGTWLTVTLHFHFMYTFSETRRQNNTSFGTVGGVNRIGQGSQIVPVRFA